jgi:hypothetical protein
MADLPISAEHLDRHVEKAVGALRTSIPSGEREARRPRGESDQPVVGSAASNTGGSEDGWSRTNGPGIEDRRWLESLPQEADRVRRGDARVAR